MKNNSRKLKGFTLVELIIVMALFSLIMTMVMSFIDPVSNLMKKTALRERTAAYSDNIEEYLDNALHYASQVYVYDGGFMRYNEGGTGASAAELETAQKYKYGTGAAAIAGENLADVSEADKMKHSEINAVADIIANNLDGAVVDDLGKPLTGVVRVLKLKNSEGGKITETSYRFKAGDTYKSILSTDRDELKNNGNLPAIVRMEIEDNTAERNVINPEHTKFYNYFYAIGNYALSNANGENYLNASGQKMRDVVNNAEDKKTSYCALTKHSAMGSVDVSASNFPISIVAYSATDSEMIVGKHVTDASDPTHIVTEPAHIFKRPAHMNTLSMALINALKFDDNNYIQYYRKKWKANATKTGIELEKGVRGDGTVANLLVPISNIKSDKCAFRVNDTKTTKFASSAYNADKTKSDIYIVYILPYDINDTVVRH